MTQRAEESGMASKYVGAGSGSQADARQCRDRSTFTLTPVPV
ncbi:hypothetical protein [Coleofasciculus sp. G2-EDA-02]